MQAYFSVHICTHVHTSVTGRIEVYYWDICSSDSVSSSVFNDAD